MMIMTYTMIFGHHCQCIGIGLGLVFLTSSSVDLLFVFMLINVDYLKSISVHHLLHLPLHQLLDSATNPLTVGDGDKISNLNCKPMMHVCHLKCISSHGGIAMSVVFVTFLMFAKK